MTTPSQQPKRDPLYKVKLCKAIVEMAFQPAWDDFHKKVAKLMDEHARITGEHIAFFSFNGRTYTYLNQNYKLPRELPRLARELFEPMRELQLEELELEREKAIASTGVATALAVASTKEDYLAIFPPSLHQAIQEAPEPVGAVPLPPDALQRVIERCVPQLVHIRARLAANLLL